MTKTSEEEDDWLFEYCQAKIDEHDALIKPIDVEIDKFNSLVELDDITQENYDRNERRLGQRRELWAAREAYYDVLKKQVFHV